MKPELFILALSVIFSIFIFCDLGTNPDTTREYYSYAAYDSSGQQIASGTLSLSLEDSSRIQGNWRLTRTGSCNYCGDQSGIGLVAGSLRNDTISLNLHPKLADNNVVLRGRKTCNRISGQWAWVTFAGITATGMFKATKTKGGASYVWQMDISSFHDFSALVLPVLRTGNGTGFAAAGPKADPGRRENRLGG